jgi:translation initiation factor eIF-2B subunit beta
MSRVNKVVIGAHSVQATGGLFSISGSLLAAMAARAHSTPVIVCTAQFKLTPSANAHFQYAAVDLGDPEKVLQSTELDLGSQRSPTLAREVEVINPWFDYIGPEFVDVLITN